MALRPLPEGYQVQPPQEQEHYVRFEPAFDLDDVRRRTRRPNRLIVTTTVVFSSLLALFIFVAGGVGRPGAPHIAAKPTHPTPTALLGLPDRNGPVASGVIVTGANDVDYEPVASIAVAPSNARNASRPAPFPPVERAPDYAGFIVTSGK